MRVRSPNSISISSAIFAQLRHVPTQRHINTHYMCRGTHLYTAGGLCSPKTEYACNYI